MRNIWACELEAATSYSPPVGEQHAFQFVDTKERLFVSLCQEIRLSLGTEIARRWVWSNEVSGLPPKCEQCESVWTMKELSE